MYKLLEHICYVRINVIYPSLVSTNKFEKKLKFERVEFDTKKMRRQILQQNCLWRFLCFTTQQVTNGSCAACNEVQDVSTKFAL